MYSNRDSGPAALERTSARVGGSAGQEGTAVLHVPLVTYVVFCSHS